MKTAFVICNGHAVDKHFTHCVDTTEFKIIHLVFLFGESDFLSVETLATEIIVSAVLTVKVVPSVGQIDFDAFNCVHFFNVVAVFEETPSCVDKYSAHIFSPLL